VVVFCDWCRGPDGSHPASTATRTARPRRLIVRALSLEVFLDESRAEMDVELHQRTVADVLEAMDPARLAHEDVPGARFELLAIHDPPSAAFLYELDLIIGCRCGPGPAPGFPRKRNTDTP